MNVNFKFSVGQRVVESATKLEGSIAIAGMDDIGVTYEVEFDQRIMGRRRHWKREKEIRAARKPKKTP